jgi:hypothetical protein
MKEMHFQVSGEYLQQPNTCRAIAKCMKSLRESNQVNYSYLCLWKKKLFEDNQIGINYGS